MPTKLLAQKRLREVLEYSQKTGVLILQLKEAALARCHHENQCSEWTCNYMDVNRIKLQSLGYEI